jgi:hypothetical protein
MIVSNRDFLNQRAWHSAGNGEFLIFNSSVKHSSCGEKDGFVRAVSKLSGYLIRPYSHASEKKQQCSLTYLTITDMGGWIPGMVMNFVTTTFAPTKMSKIRVAIDGFKKWLPQQNDYVKDWEVPEDGWDSAQPNEIHDFVKRREAKGDLATPIACSTDDFAENES